MNNHCIFQVSSLVPPEVAEIDIAIVGKNDAYFSDCDHMMFLPFDLPVRNFN